MIREAWRIHALALDRLALARRDTEDIAALVAASDRLEDLLAALAE